MWRHNFEIKETQEKHQADGCDRSWLQFTVIWRKYGRQWQFGIPFPFPTKIFKLSILFRHLPASQCHAAREVQPGPHVGWKHGYNATNTSTFLMRFVDSLYCLLLEWWKKTSSPFKRFSAQSTTWKTLPRNTQAKETRSTGFYRYESLVARFFPTISVFFSFWVLPFQISRCLTKINAIPQWFTAAFTTFIRSGWGVFSPAF